MKRDDTPALFEAFLRFANGHAPRLRAGFKDSRAKRICKLGTFTQAEWGRMRPAARLLCRTIARLGVAYFDTAVTARGGISCVLIASPGDDAAELLPLAANPDEIPWAILAAARCIGIPRHNCLLALLRECPRCEALFWGNGRRHHRFCSRTCRWRHRAEKERGAPVKAPRAHCS